MNRKIDQLGRLSIPAEMRKELGIKNGDKVNIQLKGDEIIITKYEKKDNVSIKDHLERKGMYI